MVERVELKEEETQRANKYITVRKGDHYIIHKTIFNFHTIFMLSVGFVLGVLICYYF